MSIGNKKWFVIAGNNNQFLNFVKQKITEKWPDDTSLSMSNFIYIDHPDKLRGWPNPHGWFIGTWKQHQHIRDILIYLSVAYHNEAPHPNLLEIMKDVLGEPIKKFP